MTQVNLLSNEVTSPIDQLYITMVLLGIVVVLGTIGNILVLMVYYRRRHSDQSSETDYFFINTLAISDLIVCVILVPCTMVIEWYNFHISFFLCKAYFLLNTTNLLFSTMLIALIAVDRCLCIKCPLRKILTVTKAKIAISCLLLAALLMGITGAMLVDTTPHSHNTTRVLKTEVCEEIAFQKNTNAQFLLFYDVFEKSNTSIYVLSIVIVIICYVLIYSEILKIRKKEKHMLFKSNRQSRHKNVTDGSAASELSQSPGDTSLLKPRRSLVQGFRETALFRNIRSAAILFVVAVVYIVVFTPVILIITFKLPLNIILYNLYYLNNSANPLVYCFMNSNFRRDLRRLFNKNRPKCLRKREESVTFSSRLAGSNSQHNCPNVSDK